jgi:uncharacterized protein YprB with RNaseH-like and TPR domain
MTRITQKRIETLKKELRCIHRHTIDEHPSCFAKGLVKYDWMDDREWSRVTDLPWYQFPDYKIGYFDIEVDNLKADFGTVLTWCIKEKGGKTEYSVIKKRELMGKTHDRRVTEEFVEAMKKYKILVGYYSTRFDMPYMRTKALRHGLDFPAYGEIYHFDLYYTVRNKLCLSRNSLANATEFLGIEGKTPIKRDTWRLAKYGDKTALKEVLEHNVADVEILESLHDRLDFTRKWTKRSI